MGAQVGSDEDAKRYRDGYPGWREEDPNDRDNQKFYSNQLESRPDGDYIEEILTKWYGNDELLEQHHGYVQWLFPIREMGMNPISQPLTAYEIDDMRGDPAVQDRLKRSYRLMLDFYGMELVDEAEGSIGRQQKGWQRRYHNLCFSPHNFLRITRIIKCLGELGLPHYQAPFCEHLLREVFHTKQLEECAESLVAYWIPVVKDDAAREKLLAEVAKLVPAGSGTGKGSPDPDDDWD
mmetsp:Transcript_16803/g.34225  ORF Transcript_16803/g.34225 Transcript_16803/m.34225 type:complete len:236 (-) Transcript_16803:34-741(-)